jgi:hypothetical protein
VVTNVPVMGVVPVTMRAAGVGSVTGEDNGGGDGGQPEDANP